MNCVSWWSVRWCRVSHTVMTSFSSPCSRRYQRCDAVRSVTSWRSAATSGPSPASWPATYRSITATTAACSSSSVRPTIGMGGRSVSAALDEAPGDEPVVDLEQLGGGAAPRVLAGPEHRVGREALGQERVGGRPAHGGGELGRVVPVDEEPGAPVLDERGEAADGRRHD